jgi:hypothetical protein
MTHPLLNVAVFAVLVLCIGRFQRPRAVYALLEVLVHKFMTLEIA